MVLLLNGNGNNRSMWMDDFVFCLLQTIVPLVSFVQYAVLNFCWMCFIWDCFVSSFINKTKTFSGSEVCYFITHSTNKHLQHRSQMAPHSVPLDERERAHRYQRLQLQPIVVDWNSFPCFVGKLACFISPGHAITCGRSIGYNQPKPTISLQFPLSHCRWCVCVCVFPYTRLHLSRDTSRERYDNILQRSKRK